MTHTPVVMYGGYVWCGADGTKFTPLTPPWVLPDVVFVRLAGGHSESGTDFGLPTRWYPTADAADAAYRAAAEQL